MSKTPSSTPQSFESRAGLQVSPANKIEPAGVTEHVRVRFQAGEFRRQFRPVKHSPERRWLHTDHAIRRA